MPIGLPRTPRQREPAHYPDPEADVRAANIETYQSVKSDENHVPIISADSHFSLPNPWKNWKTIETARVPVRIRISNGRLNVEFSFNEGREAWLKSDVINVRQNLPESVMASLVGRSLNSLVDFTSVNSQDAAKSAVIMSAISHIPLLTSLTYESPAGNLSNLLKAA